MRFTYCPHCGEQLTRKTIGDEGQIPYCNTCRVPLWDMARTCVICAVVNEYKEIVLIRQSYGDTSRYVCVAGVMTMGESAEDTARREIAEEIGLSVERLTYIRSYPYIEKELLMLGFKATVKKADFTLSGEVADAVWVPLDEASALLREGSIAQQLVQTVAKGASADEYACAHVHS
ncbi:MAG: NUDIX domain-containing protein [Ruminococcaceae bacterium]|nr:NUDIX domain-containing protein [Oscillospiraceae bacterium]